jgi:hypothetical protein
MLGSGIDVFSAISDSTAIPRLLALARGFKLTESQFVV